MYQSMDHSVLFCSFSHGPPELKILQQPKKIPKRSDVFSSSDFAMWALSLCCCEHCHRISTKFCLSNHCRCHKTFDHSSDKHWPLATKKWEWITIIILKLKEEISYRANFIQFILSFLRQFIVVNSMNGIK